jgi:hypothetical protein
MAGYVLTPEVLKLARKVARGLSADGEMERLLAMLDKADGLDPDKLREVVEYAKAVARDVNTEGMPATDARRVLATSAHIVELCDGLLVALSEPQPVAFPGGRAGGKLANVKVVVPVDPATAPSGEQFVVERPANEDPLGQAIDDLLDDNELVRTKAQADRFADDLAQLRVALGLTPDAPFAVMLARAQTLKGRAGELAAMRKALGDIVATCTGGMSKSEPWTGDPGDVAAMVRGLSSDLANAEGMAERPAWDVPDDHPLATHDWETWIGTLLDAERRAQAGGVRFDPDGQRARALRQALDRVELRDADGLRGLVDRLEDGVQFGGLWPGEVSLLSYASGDRRGSERILPPMSRDGDALVCGFNRVPRRAKP